MKPTIKFALYFFTLLLLTSQFVAPSTVFAQVTGRLSGSVTDPSGAVVAGATVEVMLPGGSRAVLNTVTTADGLFSIIGIQAGTYDLVISAPNYKKHVERAVSVRPAQEMALPAIKLEIGQVTEVVQVTDSQAVQTSNAEVSLNITQKQIKDLPVLGRSPEAFIQTQVGVTAGRGTTVINGQRTSFSNVTLDGINIQDNFIRTNSLDFSPNVLLLDQVSEVTVATSNTNPAAGGGSAQVIFVTPSGTNTYHGSLYWQNRNSAFSANTWFNNRDGVARPFLNRNWIGGTVGGPIIKDKLLFYGNYEAFRDHEQSTVNRTILTASARQGIFTYRDTQNVVRQVNILQAMGVQVDPATQAILQQVPGSEKINNFRVGDSTDTFLRNTAGYTFLVRNNRSQDHGTGKLDYNLSTKHTLSGSFVFNTDIIDRPDTSNDYATVPKVVNDDKTTLLSVGWRWNPASTFTNEVRGGFNLAPVIFAASENFGNAIIGGTIFSNPLNTFRTQGRNTDTYTLNDNASYLRGKHNIQFGYASQRIYVENFNEGGITPTYTLGTGTGNTGVTTQLPGASSSDITTANSLLATLAGYITSYSQTFNVTDRTSGFVKGAENRRTETVFNYAGYVTDSWKARPRFTLNAGLRYEYFTPVDEQKGLALSPQLINDNPITTLLSNATLDFIGSAAGRPYYHPDRNNFAPNIGLAWDVFGTGKTAVRAGYSVHFVNDEFIRAAEGGTGNAGLIQTVTATGLTGRVSTGLQAITAPTFKVPRTFQDNYALNRSSTVALSDPNLQSPYVQQWNLGIQHEWRGVVVDARYVGNHGTKLFRGIDLNQVIVTPDFLADFRRAQSNGNLARTATGTFNPAYNATIAGSQQLTIFPQLGSGGQLTSSTIRNLIDQGQVGELAAQYQILGLNGPFNFFSNPNALTSNLFLNYSNSTYNALQIDVRGRLHNVTFQVNYAFSKAMSDSAGTGQTRAEALLDNKQPNLEHARAPFDLTHQLKGNFVYDLPLGSGHWLHVNHLDRVLAGWKISGIVIEQSGTPFSVTSGRGTLNRSGQSGSNTANTSLTKAELGDFFKVRITPTGPTFVPATAIGTDGRGVAADGSAPFAGQVFFQPAAGTLGALQRLMFSGPRTFNMDFAVSKVTKITERHQIEFRMDASNIFNHPTWNFGDQSVTSTNFGKITGTFFGRRILQFKLEYRF